MNLVDEKRHALSVKPDGLGESLRRAIRGDVRFDTLSRTIYATDASIYEITPVGVVLPRDTADVAAVVNTCRETGVPIVARGAGTGLTGGAVGFGVQLDLSRYMNRIGTLDLEKRTIEVEPGVVLDELNAHVAAYGLQFGPDVATSSRATIGGMIANNSCGAHSVLYGRTVDHVHSLTCVLSSGEVVTFLRNDPNSLVRDESQPGDVATGSNLKVADSTYFERAISRIREEYHDEIPKRFPKVLRSNGGYGLDRLGPPGVPVDVTKILCGSEGTLAIIVGAKLNLVPLPKLTGMVVVHFSNLLSALATTPAILGHKPAAIELIDKLILDAGRSHSAIAERCGFLDGDPDAILVVEFFDDDAKKLESRIGVLIDDSEIKRAAYSCVTVVDLRHQKDVWNLRKSGLGLLMSKPGDAQPYSFVEDTAVDPSRLRDYIERFQGILQREGVAAGYYAHASVGVIHVKPVLNLKSGAEVDRMRRIADAVSDLALEFGGAFTGEHGDGIVRSCFLEKMYGPKIIAAFREVKNLFDPKNIFNPNKIVDALPMTEHLRQGPSFAAKPVKTYLDFSSHGGMAGLAGMCSGVGQCRQRLVGTMCPSYVATGDEMHTTRARANALRVALSNRGLLSGLDDPAVAEVMDLCIGCKACKTECPTGVDMAKLKVEYLAQLNTSRGASRRARWIAAAPEYLGLASRFSRVSNFFLQSKPVREFIHRKYGLDRRIAPPKLAHQTFRDWFRKHNRKWRNVRSKRGAVIYLVDTWTNYCTPEVGKAAVKLLEHAGFRVVCPPVRCCGRPAISQGLLADAKNLAEFNVETLVHTAGPGTPILGSEPSCTLTYTDEYPHLLRTQTSRRIAERVVLVETFLRRLLDDQPEALRFRPRSKPLLYHAHCHQKALVGTADANALMQRAWGALAKEIDSGCCGMAGAFGHEVEHYDVARAIGTHRLFPAVRDCRETDIAVAGYSCRTQIQHHVSVYSKHLLEFLAESVIEAGFPSAGA